MLYGIALSQLGRSGEGISELRRATMLSPSDPETFYNLAVQLYDAGDRVEAASVARVALKMRPDHHKAAELVTQCALVAGDEPFETEHVAIQPSAKSVVPGPDDPIPHLIGLGRQWTWIGFGLLAICVFGDVLLVVHNPTSPTQGLRRDPVSVIAVALWVFTSLFTFFWLLMDLIDRRKRFVWLLPVFVCGWCGLPGLPLALYLWIGRRN